MLNKKFEKCRPQNSSSLPKFYIKRQPCVTIQKALNVHLEIMKIITG